MQIALTFSLVGLLLSTAQANTSTYTKLDKHNCQVVESHEEGGHTLQKCGGLPGVDLLWVSFDARDDIRLVQASGEEDLRLDQVSNEFNHVGEAIEWRTESQKVVALILRLYLDGADDPDRATSHSFLVVAKVRPAGSCVVQVIDVGKDEDPNVRARRIADRAPSLSCLWPSTGPGGPAKAPSQVEPSPKPPRSVETIDRFCDDLAVVTQDDRHRKLLGLFSTDEHDRGRWTEFAREHDLNAAIKKDHVFDFAQVWSREDGALAISTRLTSGSGDWFHFVEYCFRPDGTLARVHSTLNTFNAVDEEDPETEAHGASRERQRYFDTDGSQIKVTKSIRDLETQRPAPKLQIMDDQEPIYKKVFALPFYELIAPHRRAPRPARETDRASPRK